MIWFLARSSLHAESPEGPRRGHGEGGEGDKVRKRDKGGILWRSFHRVYLRKSISIITVYYISNVYVIRRYRIRMSMCLVDVCQSYIQNVINIFQHKRAVLRLNVPPQHALCHIILRYAYIYTWSLSRNSASPLRPKGSAGAETSCNTSSISKHRGW